MNPEQLTLKVQEALQQAVLRAREYGHPEVTVEHLAVALLDPANATGSALLERVGVSPEMVLEELNAGLGRLARVQGEGHEPRVSPALSRILDLARKVSLEFKDDYVATEHVLLATLRDGKSPAAALLTRLGLSETSVLAALKEVRGSARVSDPGSEDTYQA